MQELELKLLAWIQLHCTNDFLDAVMPAVSVICDHGEVWLLLTALLLAWKRCRKSWSLWLMPAWEA